MFAGSEHSLSVKTADEFASVVLLKREDFLSVLAAFPRDYEVYMMIRDKVMLGGLQINVECALCGSPLHTVLKCKYLRYGGWIWLMAV